VQKQILQALDLLEKQPHRFLLQVACCLAARGRTEIMGKARMGSIASSVVAQLGDAFMLGAMGAAKNFMAFLQPMADDADAAMGASRRKRMDRTLETVLVQHRSVAERAGIEKERRLGSLLVDLGPPLLLHGLHRDPTPIAQSRGTCRHVGFFGNRPGLHPRRRLRAANGLTPRLLVRASGLAAGFPRFSPAAGRLHVLPIVSRSGAA
jgi:hypothetical protein